MNRTSNVLDVSLILSSSVMGGFAGAAINEGFGPFDPLQWETLLTGFMAVLAAYFTVKTMMKVDRHQADRHSEIVTLNLRPEALLIERAAVPGLELLNQAVMKAEKLIESGKVDSAGDLAAASLQVLEEMGNLTEAVVGLAYMEQFLNAKKVFSPDALIYFNNLSAQAEKMREIHRSVIQSAGATSDLEAKQMRTQNLIEWRTVWLMSAEQIVFACKKLKQSIERLRAQYAEAGVTFVG